MRYPRVSTIDATFPRFSRRGPRSLGWPLWLNLSLAAVALLIFVVPSYDVNNTAFKAQNLLLLLVSALLLVRARHLRFPTNTVTTWLLVGVPVLLLLQFGSTIPYIAGLDHTKLSIRPELNTVLKQLRDPAAAWLVFVLLLGHYRVLSRRHFTSWAIKLFASAGLLALLIYYFFAPSWARINYSNPRGFLAGFEGPNSLGAAVALLMPFSLAAVVDARSKMDRLLNFASLGVLGILLLLSGSRGAVVALFASGTLAGFSALLFGHRASLKQWLFAPLAIVCVVAGLMLAPSGPVERLLSTDIGSLATDLSTSRRVVQLETAVKMFQQRPASGWGLGGYEVGYSAFNPGTVGSTTPHNALLLLGVQGGFLAVLALLGYYTLIAVLGMQVYLRRKDAWGIAALSFPLSLAFLDLFFPYSLTHDVGTIVAVLIVSLHLLGHQPKVKRCG